MKTKDIADYWDKQAKIWFDEKKDILSEPETEYWIEYFFNLRSILKGNKVLEVGTANGYFANILHMAGYDVTAIDISPEMISRAKNMSNDFCFSVKYYVMDAQELEFGNESFDLVFTRSMTWILPDLKKFYSSVYRVLKLNGMFLNYDADFSKINLNAEEYDNYPPEIVEQANIIKSQLEISKHKRPERDIEVLKTVGFDKIRSDEEQHKGIINFPFKGQDMFKLKASKTLIY